MKTLATLAFSLLLGATLLPAQSPPGAPRRLNTLPPQGMMQGSQAAEEKELSRNYRLTLAFKTSEKNSQEVTLLSSSSRISMNTVLLKGESAAESITVEISGMLAEREDKKLRLDYSVGAQIPMTYDVEQPVQVVPIPGQPPAAQPVRRYSTQYNPERLTGVLIMELGKTYEVFKSGARSYTLTLTDGDAAPGK